jgi:hypothetical protein
MNLRQADTLTKPIHSWWRPISIAYVPGPITALLDTVAKNLLGYLHDTGHHVFDQPGPGVEVILTTALFGDPIRWREAALFTSRRRFNLDRTPTVVTLVHITPEKLSEMLNRFELILAKEPIDPADFAFPGLAPAAYETLVEQGRRGGPMLALLRMVQTQAMSIRVILVVGHEQPVEAYTFDLVGAHPRTDGAQPRAFYEDLAGRLVTAICTKEITAHEVLGDMIPALLWKSLSTPAAMRQAGQELGTRKFFTEMVRVDTLATVPSLPDTISSQYSEGCFATWDPLLGGLIATVTGSARPVVKDNLTDDELSVIVGIRSDGKGALVQHVEGKRNDPPSSEAVELIEMDSVLPHILWEGDAQIQGGPFEVPVARSKLHGHRGVKAYDPAYVEHVYLDQPYYYYPVSCSTEAQAKAIKTAFSHSEALRNPDDPRKVVFTVLPGHGIVIVEKWVAGKVPFQVMWEYMDEGRLHVENLVPQGPLTFTNNSQGMMILQTF